jgi:hypothetical protein
MLEGIIDLWFIFVILSLIFTVYDIRNTPVSWVQKLGWILVVLYTGPFGLFFYLLTCRNPGQDWHALYTQATWKQVINSEVHCAAGDATGVILAAIILTYTSLSMNVELVIEYVFGFISGWLIFQAGMMISMYKSYWESLTKTFFPEATSMNFMMLGMIPTMMVLMPIIPNSRDPANMNFWFIMGMGTLVGGIIAYPINYWLVKNKLKHGCMTLPTKKNTDTHPMMGSSADQHEMKSQDDSPTQHRILQLSFTKQVTITLMTFILLLIGIIVTHFLFPMEGMKGM